jgi:hypothetical protein
LGPSGGSALEDGSGSLDLGFVGLRAGLSWPSRTPGALPSCSPSDFVQIAPVNAQNAESGRHLSLDIFGYFLKISEFIRNYQFFEIPGICIESCNFVHDGFLKIMRFPLVFFKSNLKFLFNDFGKEMYSLFYENV